MKLPAVIALVMLFETQQPPGGSIEGVVVRAGTGEPIAGAQVTVQPMSPQLSLPSTGTTDAHGKFVVKDLDAGSYRLLFYADGYVWQEYGQRGPAANPGVPGTGTLVNVASGQTVRDLRVSLTPAGNVSGRIRDLEGRALAAVPVQILKAVYNFRGERTLQSGGAASTDDRGEYRVYWVTPGRYYVLAGSSVSVRRGISLTATSSLNELPGYGVSPTYYPNAADLSGATTIDVPSGIDLNSIDFVIERQPRRRIRGRVIDAATGRWPSAAAIRLVTRTTFGGTTGRESGQSYNSADGTFELSDVPAGLHEVVVEVRSRETAAPPVPLPVVPAGAGRVGILGATAGPRDLVTAGAQVRVQVGKTDVENLVITIGAAASVSGRLIVEGAARASGADRLRVQLAPSSRGAIISYVQSPAPAQANPGGAFKLDNVLPGEYRVQVAGLQTDFYVKEARFGSQDVLNTPLRFSPSAPETLEVVVRASVSRIAGTVTDEKSQPVRGVQTVLVPDQYRDRPDLFRNVTTDQNGRFQMDGVAPGDYKVFAWDAMEQFSYYDTDFVRRYEQQGHPVKVIEPSSQTIQVRLIHAAQ
ncbi:MAG TPA: carboxypeptidase regulatory-like domain-containing protein [Terriglobia bacterium]|nr:carboxypeptidase regulatory-like domain-containing protein [Terriglobia bacterium]